MKRVTVKDIANELNIAQGTVSKVLSGRPGVSEEMKRRVLDAAHALGYKVNPLAKGLSQSPIDIGIILPGVWPAYFTLVHAGIEAELKRYSNYRFNAQYRYLEVLHNDAELEACIDELISRNVRVILLFPAFDNPGQRCMQKLAEHNIKLILLGSDVNGCDRLTCVRIDAYMAGALAGDFMSLITHESRKIAVFLGNYGMLEHDMKRAGFMSSMAGTACSVAGVYETQDMPEIASIITQKVVDEYPDLEAIYVATSNSIAVCEALERADPARRIKVVATDIFPDLMPYLESRRVSGVIYQDPQRMGRGAVRCVYEYFMEGRRDFGEQLIMPSLVLRANMQCYSEAGR